MSFEFVEPSEFFEHLYQDNEFCSELGRVVLAAGILESCLRKYLRDRGIGKFTIRSTLGQLVELLKQNNLLTSNGIIHFTSIVGKRNYLSHNLYALFSSEIDETILPRSELTKGDTDIFWDKVRNEANDYRHFANLVKEADPTADKLL